MHARVLRCLLAAATVVFAAPVLGAEGAAAPQCELPVVEGHVMADRAGMLERYQNLPRSCLQDLFTACSIASGRTLLDPGSAAVCSFGYEALLKQGFGGNFSALLAWWRSQRAQLQPSH